MNRIQVILKLYENSSTLKINFSKSKLYRFEDIKIKIRQPGQMEWPPFAIKILGLDGPPTNDFFHA